MESGVPVGVSEESCFRAVPSPSVVVPDMEETFFELPETPAFRPEDSEPRLGKSDRSDKISSDSVFGNQEIYKILECVPEINGADLELVVKFITAVDLIISTPFIPALELLKCLTFKLNGPLRTWWLSQLNPALTWPCAKEELIQQYITPIDRAMLGERFINRKQKPNEDYIDYVEDIVKYLPLFAPSLSEIEVVARLWINQNSATLNYMQYRDPPDTLAALKRLARQFRVISRQRSLETSASRGSIKTEPVPVACFYCKQVGHRIATCPVRPVRGNTEPRAILPKQD